jgi:hypothetical protein
MIVFPVVDDVEWGNGVWKDMTMEKVPKEIAYWDPHPAPGDSDETNGGRDVGCEDEEAAFTAM